MTSFRQHLIDTYDGLTRRERQIADLLMENPELTLLNSATDLARMASVSNSTVTRFVKTLDFDSYDGLRRSIREEYDRGSPLSIIRQTPANTPGDLVSAFAQQETAVLESALATLDRDVLNSAAEALVHAPRVGFFGMRNSHFFAAYAHWQFVQFRRGTRLISGAGETSAEHLAGFSKGDVVLIVGVRRIVGKLRACIDILDDAGVDILLIADASSLHLAQRARWTIVCPVENEHVFDSYSGVLGVLRLLAYTALQKSGNDGLTYMANVETYHERLDEF